AISRSSCARIGPGTPARRRMHWLRPEQRVSAADAVDERCPCIGAPHLRRGRLSSDVGRGCASVRAGHDQRDLGSRALGGCDNQGADPSSFMADLVPRLRGTAVAAPYIQDGATDKGVYGTGTVT